MKPVSVAGKGFGAAHVPSPWSNPESAPKSASIGQASGEVKLDRGSGSVKSYGAALERPSLLPASGSVKSSAESLDRSPRPLLPNSNSTGREGIRSALNDQRSDAMRPTGARVESRVDAEMEERDTGEMQDDDEAVGGRDSTAKELSDSESIDRADEEDNPKLVGGNHMVQEVVEFELLEGHPDGDPAVLSKLPMRLHKAKDVPKKGVAVKYFLRGKRDNGIAPACEQVYGWWIDFSNLEKPALWLQGSQGKWISVLKPRSSYKSKIRTFEVVSAVMVLMKSGAAVRDPVAVLEQQRGVKLGETKSRLRFFKAFADENRSLMSTELYRALMFDNPSPGDANRETQVNLLKRKEAHSSAGARKKQKFVAGDSLLKPKPLLKSHQLQKRKSQDYRDSQQQKRKSLQGGSRPLMTSGMSNRPPKSGLSRPRRSPSPASPRNSVEDDDDSDEGRGESGGEVGSDYGGEGEDGEAWGGDTICYICDDGGELILCDGPCMRSFHSSKEAGIISTCPSLNLPKELLANETWYCRNCEGSQHQCYVCGELGASEKDEEHPEKQKVFLCDVALCGHFYHPECVAKEILNLERELSKSERKERAESLAQGIREGREILRCPLHECQKCRLPEGDDASKDREERLVRCRRCPRAWHVKCIPRELLEPENEIQRVWNHEEGSTMQPLLFCGRHEVLESTLTPPRNHYRWPPLPSGTSKLSRRKLQIDEDGEDDDRAWPHQASTRLPDLEPADSGDAEEEVQKTLKRKRRVAVVEDDNDEEWEVEGEAGVGGEYATSAPRGSGPGRPALSSVAPAITSATAVGAAAKSAATEDGRRGMQKPLASRPGLQQRRKEAGVPRLKAGNLQPGKATTVQLMSDRNVRGEEDVEYAHVSGVMESGKQMMPVQGGSWAKLAAKYVPNFSTERLWKNIDKVRERVAGQVTIKSIQDKMQVVSIYRHDSRFKDVKINRIESVHRAVEIAWGILKNGGDLRRALEICPKHAIHELDRMSRVLLVSFAPFLHGSRYTSYGRHFTNTDKLDLIVSRLLPYVVDGDCLVDTCCGANDFSVIAQAQLNKAGKKMCTFSNFDIAPPKNTSFFTKSDWFDVPYKPGARTLPTGDKLIMGLNPPFGVRASLASQFSKRMAKFEPKLIILIVPPNTESPFTFLVPLTPPQPLCSNNGITSLLRSFSGREKAGGLIPTRPSIRLN
eukprot:TRINITY_DN1004_c0_g6_i3.p1 TRINITY_DN1004_c0_g6~~TRINITY_DN1004_c0_g6_i3.p1  ORF type:complete len:1293 (-),score=211.39 TRINITY_DN1004_c0_g6_i3:1358-4936(-)